jgi:hypothetical protein
LDGIESRSLFTPALARLVQRVMIDPFDPRSVSEITPAFDTLRVSEIDGRPSLTGARLTTTSVVAWELGPAAKLLPAEMVVVSGYGVASVAVEAGLVEVPAGVAEAAAGEVDVPPDVVSAGVVEVPPGVVEVPLQLGGHGVTNCCVKVFELSGRIVWYPAPGNTPLAPTSYMNELTKAVLTVQVRGDNTYIAV